MSFMTVYSYVLKKRRLLLILVTNFKQKPTTTPELNCLTSPFFFRSCCSDSSTIQYHISCDNNGLVRINTMIR